MLQLTSLKTGLTAGEGVVGRNGGGNLLSLLLSAVFINLLEGLYTAPVAGLISSVQNTQASYHTHDNIFF